MEINWTEVVVNVIWIAMALVVIPLIKKGANILLPMITNFLKEKTNSTSLTLILDTLQGLITSAEINILGEKKGTERKEYILNLLQDQGLVTADNLQLVSDLIDGICEMLTAEGIINPGRWKEYLDSIRD